MKGHIRERSSGHWAIVLDTRDPVTGKRKRRWHSFVGTKRQAQIECARLISEVQTGIVVEPSRITVAVPRPLARTHQAASRPTDA
jgi:hypothetical protein